MRNKQCDVIRRELEETTLSEDFSGTTAQHLRGCADCREFQRQQMKLRQIIGSLGTVNAPADFDFRLRARLAADSEGSGVRYWSFAVRGLATVAVLVVFGVGAAIVWQSMRPGPAVAGGPQQQGPSQQEESRPTEPQPTVAGQPDLVRNEDHAGLRNETPVVADNNLRRVSSRPVVFKPRGPIATLDRSSLRANVYPIAEPALDTATVFPIEGSLQSVKVSVDDGRGNARTISFPTVSFGSQRVLATGNQLASQGVW
jgi:hypothetical protein